MNNLNKLNLEFNPFKDITPVISSKNLIWAGMEDVKTKISRAYLDCVENNSKQVILNWGPYGGGKTFSAYYFQNKDFKDQNLLQIYVRCPKDGTKSTTEFFNSIIDYISFEKIQIQIQNILLVCDEKKFIDFLSPTTGREYAKAICLMGSKDNSISDLMNRFLYTGLTKTELKKLGLAKDIQSDTDSIKFLSGLLSCFIGDGHFYKGKVVIWLDEMEDLIYYSSKHYKTFSQVLRDLVDSISNSFLLFLNFTLAEGEESTIELILGAAVWSRVTKKIRYKSFSQEDAKNYALQLLNESKVDRTDNRPFDESTIETILQFIPENSLTPREINKYINSFISYILENEVEDIQKTTINSWINEYHDE